MPFFLGGYIALWTAVALPGYLAWRALEMPLAEGQAWAGRLAGATLLAAALWQITPPHLTRRQLQGRRGQSHRRGPLRRRRPVRRDGAGHHLLYDFDWTNQE